MWTHSNTKKVDASGNVTAGDHNPSETSAQGSNQASGGDYGYKGAKERQGQSTQPSWVIGTSNIVKDASENNVVNESPQRTVTFYNSSGVVGQTNWNKFEKAVSKIP